MSSRRECVNSKYVEIAFEMDKIPLEKQQKIFEAENILKDVGISFDTIYDVSDHERIWQFNNNLLGPVHINPIQQIKNDFYPAFVH